MMCLTHHAQGGGCACEIPAADLNDRHKATGEPFPQAVEVMTALNAEASAAVLAAGVRCATDVTGFGLLGHLYKPARASGVTAVLDAAAVPLIDRAMGRTTRRTPRWACMPSSHAALTYTETVEPPKIWATMVTGNHMPASSGSHRSAPW
ncbi:AIR synthase-related protein [Streptosporangium sp. CA-115845]|uniref:AIR synthase-related protein n=1 Tax=Streptosporangium sp. CA-115845 TaxID=3240071 RepID=UPI003D8E0CB2